MASRNVANNQSVSVPIIAFGAVMSGVGVYYHVPSFAALWVAVIISAFMEPAPVLTGKDEKGQPQPASEREKRAFQTYSLLSRMKRTLFFPSSVFFDVRTPFWFGVSGLAIISVSPAFLPYRDVYSQGLDTLWWVNPIAVMFTLFSYECATREVAPLDYKLDQPQPLVTWKYIDPIKHLPFCVVGGVIGGVFGTKSAFRLGEQWIAYPLLFGAGAAVAIFGFGAYFSAREVAIEDWKNTAQASLLWTGAFGQVFAKTPIKVLRREVFDQVIVDTVETGTLPADDVAKKQDQFKSFVPEYDLTIFHATLLDGEGNKVEGQAARNRVHIILTPPNHVFDISPPNIDQQLLYYSVNAALAISLDRNLGGRVDNSQRMITSAISPLHKDDSDTAIWCAEVNKVNPDTDTALARSGDYIAPIMSELFGASVNSDDKVLHALVIGDVEDVDGINCESPIVARCAQYLGDRNPGGDVLSRFFARLMDESTWVGRFSQVKKVSAYPPEPQWATAREAKIGKATLHQMAFVTLNGSDPMTFMGEESNIAATLQGAPFVSVTGYTDSSNGRGHRHNQAFTLTWSHDRFATSPQTLLPPEVKRGGLWTAISTSSSPEHWVLAGVVNKSFDAAKIARPEVVEVKPLAKRGSSVQTWKISLRLHGGVTVAAIRSKLQVLKSALAVDWVGVYTSSRQSEAVLCAGKHPHEITLENDKDWSWLTEMLWQQAFYDSGTFSRSNGELPAIIDVSRLEYNQAMERIVFTLPAGIAISDVWKREDRLASATGSKFTRFTLDPDDGRNVIALVSQNDPLPDVIDYDFTVADRLKNVVVLGSSIEGTPLVWNPATDPHLLLVGLTGSGKSSAVQGLIYGTLANDWDIIIADPIKGAADFQPFKEWTSAFVDTIGSAGRGETLAVLESVYGEVQRRIALNAQYGVGNFSDLPDDVRPRRLVVFLDEFNSLISAVAPPKPPAGASSEVMTDYARKLSEYEAVLVIGKRVADIAAQARSVGVALVLIAQGLKRDDLKNIPGGGTLRTNLSRLLLGKASDGDRMAALRSPENVPRLGEPVPRGRGVFEPITDSGEIIQVWYSHPPTVNYPRELSARRTRPTWVLDYDKESALTAVRFEGEVIEEGVVEDLGDIDVDWSVFDPEPESGQEVVVNSVDSTPSWWNSEAVTTSANR